MSCSFCNKVVPLKAVPMTTVAKPQTHTYATHFTFEWSLSTSRKRGLVKILIYILYLIYLFSKETSK